MTTAVIRLSPSTTALEDEPLEVHPAQIVEDQRTGPSSSMLLDHEISRFQRSIGAQRDSLRNAIIRKIVNADDPDEYIETTLQALIGSTKPGRLDDAVDILSQAGTVLPQFLHGSFSQLDVDDVDEDYWYVLIRAVGKSKSPTARMYVEMLWSRCPEAAVEALGDIGDEESIDLLRTVVKGAPTEFMRTLAEEVLEECVQ